MASCVRCKLFSLLAIVGTILSCSLAANAELRPLRMLVPLSVGFEDFVYTADNRTFEGFAIDLFSRSMQEKQLPYEFIGFGDGHTAPDYDDMIHRVHNQEYDGVVADVTITAERMDMVDFTFPYIQSTLVLIVPNTWESHMWTFLQPFSKELWACIIAMFVATGVALSIIEHKVTDSREGKVDWRAHLEDVFWFVALTLFFCQREKMSTRLGKTITMVWLVVVLILTSSYTASLTLLLTTEQDQQLQNFESLRSSNLKFGISSAYFVERYVKNNLHIKDQRLIPISPDHDYESFFQTKTIGAILAESPYAEIFLKKNCQYKLSEDQLAYFGGFGFVFPKNSSLTKEISQRIVSLAQDGELQKLKDSWFGSKACPKHTIGANMPVPTFGGLFIVVSILYGVFILFRFFTFLKDKKCTKSGSIVPLEGIQIS